MKHFSVPVPRVPVQFSPVVPMTSFRGKSSGPSHISHVSFYLQFFLDFYDLENYRLVILEKSCDAGVSGISWCLYPPRLCIRAGPPRCWCALPRGRPVCAVRAGLTDLSFGVDLPGFSTVKLFLPFCD